MYSCDIGWMMLAVGIFQLYGDSTNAASVNIDSFCPRMVHHVFEDYVPAGKENAGNYTEPPVSAKLMACVESCCADKVNCNVAFVFSEKCYHVQCISNELCLPSKNITSQASKQPLVQMVLVNPVDEDISWKESLKLANFADLNTMAAEANFRSMLPSQNLRNYFKNYEGGPLPISDDEPNEPIYGGVGHPYSLKLSASDLKGMYPSINRFADTISDPLYMDSGMEGDQQMDESKYYETSRISCDIGLDRICPPYQRCVQMVADTSSGFCDCIDTYFRNNRGDCVKTPLSLDELVSNDDVQSNQVPIAAMSRLLAATTTIAPTISSVDKKLTVSVVSKDVRLPEKEVTLAAYTVSDGISGNATTYKYMWSLISQPGGDVNGTMSDQTKDTIKLTNLSEGLYRFKVVVTGTNNISGEAFANVTVLPQKRINQAPNVVITPDHVTVKLPTSQTILDGGTSTDDDKIVLWHWDLTQGPIDYHPVLPETSTLQLSDLTQPGNYTFQLTLTDSDGAKNSTTAFVTVLKANDYPPEANAGADVIVYLPHNNVTLNGSLSTDDREIVSWEWTKAARDVSKAVDMQNTRTPYLQLSNLEEGLYTFVLKVSDISNQTSTASVNVFVKPPTNSPPHAFAGGNATVILPRTWVTLNASQSTDDRKIERFEWTQLSGPTTSFVISPNTSIANATGLTVGSYVFQVNVFDENKNNATDITNVTVIQERNTAPIANAGGDQTFTMPVNAILLNGTKSSDDLRVTNFTWERDGSSLAIGTIIGESNKEPVLVLSNIVPGRYVFRLTVADAQGLTSTDTVSVIVHPDPLLLNLVELTLTVDVSVLTQFEVDSLLQKLELLIGDRVQLRIRDLRMNPKTGEAILVFFMEQVINGETVTMSGLAVEQLLFDRFWKDSNILGTLVSDVRTSRCQNPCSGHGACNSATRTCICNAFWMPDIFWFWGISQANCNWSIVYVVIGIFVVFLCTSFCCWGITRSCKTAKKPALRQRIKPQKYSPLGTHDDEAPSLTRSTPTLSDSETDSDIVFESHTKPNGILRNGSSSSRNGKTTRLGRRIKT